MLEKPKFNAELLQKQALFSEATTGWSVDKPSDDADTELDTDDEPTSYQVRK